MVYSVSQNKAIINGQNGIYDKKVTDPDVKYGRNAENNYESYTKELGAKVYPEGLPHPPLEFEYRYIPQGQYSTKALIGNAYEELGKKKEVSVAELNQKLNANSQKINELNKQIDELHKNDPNYKPVAINSDFTADALDINGDGKVDVGEYATSTMAADMLDNNPSGCDIKNLDGVITNKGEDASTVLYSKQNVANAKGLFTQIYNKFNLNQAAQEFGANPNNQ